MLHQGQESIGRMRAHIREHVRSLGGGEEQAMGMELAGLVKLVADRFEAIASRHLRDSDLSPARWRVLLLLLAEEECGHREGCTPTDLSRWQRVSKNTMSALLRGLEERQLIRRTVDAADRRVFRIRLSEAGRELIASNAQERIAHVNGLVAGLSAQEQAQLADLLGRLYRSLVVHGGRCRPEGECDPR